MSRRGNRGVMMEDMIMPTKIRKRGCSSSSSSSSRVYNYRLNKRAILVGKNRAALGLGRSRSSTPVPTWRNTPLRSAIDSPKYSQSGKSTRPVSARRLAATLWEMNDMPSPKMSESNVEVIRRQQRKNGSKISGSGFLPPHLSDPPHSPTVSEKMDRSGTGSRQRRTPSISRKLMSTEQNVGVIDSVSNASFMEDETRSRPQTTSGSSSGFKNRLKDISSALTTSKELLKIINRIWARADQPSSSMSLISALHTELERARLQVNRLIQEQRSDKNEKKYLMKCFAEEKASWKNKEQQAVEAAIGSIADELEVERKLRRRLESLNAKLGKELAGIKSSFMKAVKELESEKRARELTEQVCDELARNIDGERAEVEKLKRESAKVHEEAEKEKEMLELADKLLEERAQMKQSEAKHQFEEKNTAIGKLRKQLEVFLEAKREIVSHQNQGDDDCDDDDDVENGSGLDSKEDSVESDLRSIELDLNKSSNIDKGYKWDFTSAVDQRLPANNETKARNPASRQMSRRSISLQRSISDGVEWANQSLGEEGYHEIEKEAPRNSYVDEMQRVKSIKGHKNHLLPSSRLGLLQENHSPSQDMERLWPPRDPCITLQERSSLTKSRGEGHTTRTSKW